MQAMALMQLVYVSRREPWLTAQELERIVGASAGRNQIRQISGVLIAGTANIVQLIEGEANEVESLFERIQRDRRHTNVRRIRFTEISQRIATSHMQLVQAGTREARQILKQLAIANAPEIGELSRAA
jgi:hypothetical protein